MLFQRKNESNTVISSKRIVVTSAAKADGVSFISELIATGVRKKGSVTLAELGSGHFYNSIGFDKHFLSTGFVDFYQKIRNVEHISCGSIGKKALSNMYADINWFVRTPGDSLPLSAAECYRIYNLPTDNYCVYDCSGLDDDIKLSLLADADYPIFVIDPLPSKLAESMKLLEKIRLSLPNTAFVINKMNNGVHLAELNRYLGIKDYFSFPSISSEIIYKAEYNRCLFCDMKGFDQTLQKTQDMLCRQFF